MVPEQADEGEEMPQGSAADHRRPACASGAGRVLSAGWIVCRLRRRLLQQHRRAGRRPEGRRGFRQRLPPRSDQTPTGRRQWLRRLRWIRFTDLNYGPV